MSFKPYVISGEAYESGSEEEHQLSETLKSYQPENYRGKVINGEATESDEDFFEEGNFMNSVNKSLTSLPPKFNVRKELDKHSSILVKKLFEKNLSLQRNLNDFIDQTSFNAYTQLNIVNQRLLKCQVEMQHGTEFLKIIKSNLSLLDCNIKSLLSINHIPLIKF